MNDLLNLYTQVAELTSSLAEEKDKVIGGNKSAGARARKTVAALVKVLKELKKGTLPPKEKPQA